jgi:hypothetical protein
MVVQPVGNSDTMTSWVAMAKLVSLAAALLLVAPARTAPMARPGGNGGNATDDGAEPLLCEN